MKTVLLAVGLFLVGSTAMADEHVIVLRQQTITSHPQRPLAATEVAKLPVKMPLPLSAPSLTGRIETPTSVAPF